MISEKLNKHATDIAEALVYKLKEKKLTIVLAESCTAGLASSLIAGIPGASLVLWGSFVCYTQEAKVSMLNIENDLLLKHGLVSEQAAKAMAAGALQKSGADIAASCTGLAGPGTDTEPQSGEGSPLTGDGSLVKVGTVYIAVALKNGEIKAKEYHFEGSRNEVRLQAAIKLLRELDNFF